MPVENVLFHNVGEMVELAGGGLQLHRVPRSVQAQISERGGHEMRQPSNCEIRFKSSGDAISITLSALEQPVTAVLFHGPFMTRERLTIGLEPTRFTFHKPPHLKIYQAKGLRHGGYGADLWRFMFAGGNGYLVFHGVEGEGICPPSAADLPTKRYLAYGTSLTAGRASTGPHLTYAYQTAWRLGADLLNIGSGGSCFCEPGMANYLASRTDWDFATLGLSLNMLSFDLDEFRKRVEYLVATIAEAHQDKPMFCITNWPCFNDQRIFANLEEGQTEADKSYSEDYRKILRRIVATLNRPNLHILEGPELFPGFGNLSDDLIHPSDLGMIQMAENLAAAIKPNL